MKEIDGSKESQCLPRCLLFAQMQSFEIGIYTPVVVTTLVSYLYTVIFSYCYTHEADVAQCEVFYCEVDTIIFSAIFYQECMYVMRTGFFRRP